VSGTDWWRRIDEAADGRALDLGLYGLSAAFAAITAVTSTLPPHRAWGAVAVWGYLAATAAAVIVRGAPARAVVTGLAWLATAWLPLVLQAVARAGGNPARAQEEVVVVEQAGQRLLDTGTPYLDRADIATLPVDGLARLLAYVPYQPGMALFGLPRAVTSDAWWTDARIWFALVTAAALVAALWVIRAAGLPPLIRAAQAATVLPLCALALATGGDDLPVLGLCLLALALAARGWLARSGLAAGAASALKLFAWPVALVLAVHAATRRRLLGFAAGALGLPVLVLLPAVLIDRDAAVENLLAYPFGQGLVTSPAQSPFPGRLVATALPGGRTLAIVLLAAAALAIAVGLLRRPPRTTASAAAWTAYGLLAAILLMPSTRFGYLLYPVAFLIWVPALRRAETEAGSAAAAQPIGVHLRDADNVP